MIKLLEQVIARFNNLLIDKQLGDRIFDLIAELRSRSDSCGVSHSSGFEYADSWM